MHFFLIVFGVAVAVLVAAGLGRGAVILGLIIALLIATPVGIVLLWLLATPIREANQAREAAAHQAELAANAKLPCAQNWLETKPGQTLCPPPPPPPPEHLPADCGVTTESLLTQLPANSWPWQRQQRDVLDQLRQLGDAGQHLVRGPAGAAADRGSPRAATTCRAGSPAPD